MIGNAPRGKAFLSNGPHSRSYTLAMTHSQFDAAYYRRFYLTPATRAMSRPEAERRGAVIASVVAHLDIPVRRILDAGCGLGWFKRPLQRAFPEARYVGIELSEYLCDRYGWRQASVVDYRDRGRFDLVVCCDVIQYLDDRTATRAIANLAALCRGAMYLHVPTQADWRERIDFSGTDADVYVRSAEWYRKRLRKYFRHMGFGIHIKRDVPYEPWELEEADG